RVTRLEERELGASVSDGTLGISARRPADWHLTKRDRVIALRSADGCLALSMSAPGPADNARTLRESSIAVLRRNSKDATVRMVSGNPRLGGIPTTTDVITLANQKGGPTRVLLSVGTGRVNAYLTEIVLRYPSCQGDLQLAQLVLGTVRYSK